jgi:hypothetical protein
VDIFQLNPLISDTLASEKMIELNDELQGWLIKMDDPFE